MKTYQFTFTNKESYLQFRAAWKSEYKELSSKIREAKIAIKVSNKAFNPYENDYHFNMVNWRKPANEKKDLKPYWATLKVLGDANYDYLKLKEKAKESLEMLSQAKIEAQKQYESQVISFSI